MSRVAKAAAPLPQELGTQSVCTSGLEKNRNLCIDRLSGSSRASPNWTASPPTTITSGSNRLTRSATVCRCAIQRSPVSPWHPGHRRRRRRRGRPLSVRRLSWVPIRQSCRARRRAMRHPRRPHSQSSPPGTKVMCPSLPAALLLPW